MFDISTEEIGALSDSDLRVLVARLCEKQVREAHIAISSVTAGGDQRAKDGGLDVRVDLPKGSPSLSFIPSRLTGFQVKQEKRGFPRRKILKEMRPNGRPRPVLQELALNSGAYIIVSGWESPSDDGLLARRAAMRDAVNDVANSDALTLDFYGADRVAQWTNQYPGLVAWVLRQVGRPRMGWRPFGNWASTREVFGSKYLLDQTARLYEGAQRGGSALSIEDGLNRIRGLVSQAGRVVRLVGLSGTGKTRLVQALFDERVGQAPLDKEDAVYADLADEPEPSPREMIDLLASDGRRAILIVDNCPPSTHRVLATAARQNAAFSLVTIEFDVGEDEPEGTEVFRLEPASQKVISELLKHRVPQVAQLDRGRISNLSGGNARLALALAEALQEGESTSKLTDADLFDRLFYQRQQKDPSLLIAAETCALVYSFDGVTLDGDQGELPLLAELAGQRVEEFYRHLAILTERDLVQHRGKWRALLPHALAAYLAHRALSHIPIERICILMETRASERLLQSFTRRLGYLHDSQHAQSIGLRWLAHGGLLSNVENLTPLGKRLVQNIAPLNPVATLVAIERGIDSEKSEAILQVHQSNRHSLLTVIRSLAYDAELFSRAAMLLARFLAAEPVDNRNNSAESDFKELFHITLSGTHASIEQRLGVVNSLIKNSNESIQRCGLIALDELLEASRFSSSHDFNFGGRARDFGWYPRNTFQTRHWYRLALDYAARLVLSDQKFSDKVRTTLALSFRGLWAIKSIRALILACYRSVSRSGFWSEGWIAIQTTISFDGKNMSTQALKRLRRLERELRPRDLLETAKAYVFTKAWGALDVADIDDFPDDANPSQKYTRIEAVIRSLGREVADNADVLEALLPELVTAKVGRVQPFGAGLADGTADVKDLAWKIADAMAIVVADDRDVGLLQGFLAGAAQKNSTSVNEFLDDAVHHPILGFYFVLLQIVVGIDSAAMTRLSKALDLRLAPTWSFSSLALGGVSDQMPSQDLEYLVLRIAGLQDGYSVAALILSMRIHSIKSKGSPVDEVVCKCGRALIDSLPTESADSMLDHRLGEIAKVCLAGRDSAIAARAICRRIVVSENAWSMLHRYENLVAAVFQAQPFAALDELVGDGTDTRTLDELADSFSERNSLSKTIPVQTLLEWAAIDPQKRFPALATIVGLFPREADEHAIIPAAVEILRQAPDKRPILAQFERSIEPHSWVGSMATALEHRRALIHGLADINDQAVNAWIEDLDVRLSRSISYWREQDKRDYETFE